MKTFLVKDVPTEEATFTNDIEREIGIVMRGKDVSAHHIPTAEVRSPLTDQLLRKFQEIHENTAKECLCRAEELESAAADLRNRAAILVHAATQIPDDYRRSIEYETEARNRAMALLLVNPQLQDDLEGRN